MIKIKRITKKYNDKAIVDIRKEIVLPSRGIVLIHGPSGSGKTTIVNAIAGLIDFEGEIEINGKEINRLTENQKDEMRLRNFGFVFQDFKLFENDTVTNNIDLVLSSSFLSTSKNRKRRIGDILHLVGMEHKAKAIVNTLSGGEKQRVAIARALINSPSFLICDEPTGALDSKNSKQIMDILKKISSTSLVILISHDFDLASDCANQTIELCDGKITNVFNLESKQEKTVLPIIKLLKRPKKSRIPLFFLFNYSKQALRKTKWRTLINNIILSFGLLSFGFSFVLQDSINHTINNSYGNLIDQKRIFVEPKAKQNSSIRESCSYDELEKIMGENQDIIRGIGICYEMNFENSFKDMNVFTLISGEKQINLPNYSIRSINDYEWLDLLSAPVYPREINEMEDDEVIITLSVDEIEYICRKLNIAESIISFSNYLLKRDLYICVELANASWQYSDQQIVRIKGFTIGEEPILYNDNPRWNQYFFEERMRLPITYKISEEPAFPWTMKKIHYYKTLKDIHHSIEKLLLSRDIKNRIIEIPNERYYPNFKQKNRLLVFKNYSSYIDLHDIEEMQNNIEIDNVTYGTSGGYYVFPDSFIEGFAHRMIISSSESQLISIADNNTFLSLGQKDKMILPSGSLSCYFADSLENGVTFKSHPQSLIYGQTADQLNEIVVSKNIALNLFGYVNCVGQKIYYSYVSSEINKGDHIERIFTNGEFVITGVSDSNKNVIYHKPTWLLLFFRINLNLSAFDLIPITASFVFDNYQDAKEKLSFLSLNYPEYQFTHPYEKIKNSVEDTSRYLNFFVVLLSIIATSMSFVFIIVLDYLFIIENKKSVGLLRCLGINRNEAQKLIISYSVVLSMLSFISSSVFLLLYAIYSSLPISSFQSVFKAIVSMLLISIFLATIPAFLSLNKLRKYNVIETLKN